MDHAYFGATRDYKSKGPNGVLYRLIRSQMQLNYIVELEKEDYQRIKKYFIQPKSHCYTIFIFIILI